MPRTEARMHLDIWDDFAGYTSHARLAYCVILTEPTLTHAGVGALRVNRWARQAGTEAEQMRAAIKELCAGDPLEAKLVVDDDTEEVLVRSLIRADRVDQQPFVLKSAIAAALLVESPLLREVLAAELRKLPPRPPDRTSSSGRRVTYPDPHAAADALDGSAADRRRAARSRGARTPTSPTTGPDRGAAAGPDDADPPADPPADPSAKGLRKGFADPSEHPARRVARGWEQATEQRRRRDRATPPDPAGTPDARPPTERVSKRVSQRVSERVPQRERGGGGGGGSSSVSTTAVDEPRARTRTRAREAPPIDDRTDNASAVPTDYAPTELMLDWAAEHCPDVDAVAQTSRLIDHYRSLPGTDGHRGDWNAVWRLWMRREQDGPRAPAAGRGRHRGHLAPVPGQSTPLTNAEVDAILGAETPPNPPEDIARAGVDACKAWAAEHMPAWREARRARATERLAQGRT